MANINDTYASVLSGYSGSVNDRRSELLTGILAYATPLSLNDMEAAALASLGYTGALNDAWDKYIKALGGFGISAKADYLSSTFYGNPVPFLFASAQPGVWYDPSDLTTMFQDNLGSTPVTAPGQTVGLLLDKSKNGVGTNGSSRRNLLVATATLSTQSVTVTAVAHTLSFTGTGTVTLTGASIAGPLVGTGASNRVSLTFTPTAASLTLTVVGSVTLAQLEIGSTATAYQPITTSWSATLAGNHATQATSTQRPIYGINPIVGTRNLLTYSSWSDAVAGTPGTAPTGWAFFFGTGAQTSLVGGLDEMGAQAIKFDATVGQRIAYNQQVNVVAGNTYSLSADVVAVSGPGGVVVNIPSGTAVGTATNVVSPSTGRVTATYVCTTSGTVGLRLGLGITVGVTGTSSITFKKPQFEVGTTATTYQKVVTQYEVTQTGIQSMPYLSFDGVDDGMVIGTITPATNKVQVFVGVRKLSDVARGVVVELSVDTDLNAGSFALTAPNGAGLANFAAYAGGSVRVAGGYSTGNAAPVTKVISFTSDISADVLSRRQNATDVGTITTDQGTGNFLAYPIYIGRRAGASTPLNGRIYSLIVRFGANLTTGQITSTEKWVNSKTGAY